MRVIEVKRHFFVSQLKELPPLDQYLLFFAKQAQANSQSPYSGFKVGAAVLDMSGNTSLGTNVERCTYTQTTHAEQNAIDSMVAQYGPIAICSLAINAINHENHLSIDEVKLEDLIFPCGHCLQIIWENCLDADVKIISYLGNDLVARTTIGSLLPVRFGPSDLGINIFPKKYLGVMTGHYHLSLCCQNKAVEDLDLCCFICMKCLNPCHVEKM